MRTRADNSARIGDTTLQHLLVPIHDETLSRAPSTSLTGASKCRPTWMPLAYGDPANALPTNGVHDQPTRSSFAVIAIYIVTKNMTAEQHSKGRDLLREAGAPESAMKVHSCFGEDGQLQVFDVWESQEAFDQFLTYLGPVMAELGIELAQPPVIMPIVDLVQQ
jgi:hypothetical protein